MSNDTLAKLEEVFSEVFDDDISLTPETTAADVDGWDSVMHVNLMLEIEAAFGVRFNSADVTGLKNVGQLLDLIAAKAG